LQVALKVERTELSRLSDTDNLFQSDFWGRFKSRYGWQPRAFVVDTGTSGGEARVLALVRELSSGLKVAYVPYGPDVDLSEEDYGLFLEALSGELEGRLPEGTVFVRFDLPWPSPYGRGRPGTARPGTVRHGAPRPAHRVRELRMNFGTRRRNLRKAPSDTLPVDTVIVDLTEDESALLSQMRSKTRYNVRLSKRSGVRVDQAGSAEIARWYRLYDRTTRRHRIVRYGLEYFREMMSLAERNAPSGPDLRLLLARDEEEILAGIILVLMGRHSSYLYGASSARKRSAMPAYRLQWRAMQIAKANGCLTYDLFGIPPTDTPSHPMHGLYRFKTGFGGAVLHRMGCWDFPFLPELYRRCREEELGSPGYRR